MVMSGKVVMPRLFLIFLQHKELLKIYYTDVIHFA